MKELILRLLLCVVFVSRTKAKTNISRWFWSFVSLHLRGLLMSFAKLCHASKKRQSWGAGKYGNLRDARCQPLYSKQTVTQKR